MKNDPDRLCPSCAKFDYDMNRRDGVSMDIYVVCDHEEKSISLEKNAKVPPPGDKEK